MLLPWKDPRCIICLQEHQDGLTNAHVIPRSVGGRLAITNVCADCNSRLGYSAEAGLKADPRVRISIEDLQNQIPELARAMRAGQEFIARDEDAVIRAIPHGEGYRILDSPQEGGSRIKDPQRAWEEIETTLRRQLGASDDDVDAVRAMHEVAEEGELVELLPGLSIKKGSVEEFGLTFTEPLVADLCLLAITYLFLSVLVQGAIYDEAFQPIREALLGDDGSDAWGVESFLVRSRRHEAWHGLAVNQVLPHLVVQIRLFGQHAWIVTFPRISCRENSLPARSYHLDLMTGKEQFSE